MVYSMYIKHDQASISDVFKISLCDDYLVGGLNPSEKY